MIPVNYKTGRRINNGSLNVITYEKNANHFNLKPRLKKRSPRWPLVGKIIAALQGLNLTSLCLFAEPEKLTSLRGTAEGFHHWETPTLWEFLGPVTWLGTPHPRAARWGREWSLASRRDTPPSDVPRGTWWLSGLRSVVWLSHILSALTPKMTEQRDIRASAFD